MPRKLLIRTKHCPYHITARTQNKEWFSLSMDETWDLAKKSLAEAHKIYRVELISFVLMNNHYHMLLYTPDANLDLFVYEFNKRFALRIKEKSGQLDRIFGSRYKWCLIESQKYFMNCYRYVYQNPLRAGVVNTCEAYPFSTLSLLVRGEKFCVPIHDQYGFKDEFGLMWINQRIDTNEENTLKMKLSRSVLVDLRPRRSFKNKNA